MPRFFFNVHDGVEMPDLEGVELPDLRSARNEAVQLSAGMLRDAPEQFWNHQEWAVDVTDESGLILFTLTFVGTQAPALREVSM